MRLNDVGTLEDIIKNGNRGHVGNLANKVYCKDGFSVSVIAGGGAYCSPRPAYCFCALKGMEDYPPHEPNELEPAPHDYPGPYIEVEVGFPSERPEPWDVWGECAEDPDRPTETVYPYVPIYMIKELIELHGGEK